MIPTQVDPGGWGFPLNAPNPEASRARWGPLSTRQTSGYATLAKATRPRRALVLSTCTVQLPTFLVCYPFLVDVVHGRQRWLKLFFFGLNFYCVLTGRAWGSTLDHIQEIEV